MILLHPDGPVKRARGVACAAAGRRLP